MQVDSTCLGRPVSIANAKPAMAKSVSISRLNWAAPQLVEVPGPAPLAVVVLCRKSAKVDNAKIPKNLLSLGSYIIMDINWRLLYINKKEPKTQGKRR